MIRAYNSRQAVVACALALGAAACSDASPVAGIPVRVEVTPVRDTVLVGSISTRLVARAFNAQNDVISSAVIAWRSDQPFIAAVDSLTGAVTGVAPGVAAITARAGTVADTAEVFVVNALSVFLPLDTILLAPGDTFTIPVQVLTPGGTPPAVTFSGGAGAIATVDPATGLVTAVGPGAVEFAASADTVTARGGIQVRVIPDTLFGLAYVGLQGAVNRRIRLGSRGFNHPTDDGQTLFQLAARTGAGDEEFDAFLIDSLVGPTVRAVGTLPPSALDPGNDPVCLPSTSFVFYRRIAGATLVGLSVAGGTVSITSDQPIPGGGGRAISGRLAVTLQVTDVPGDAGRITARGTFVVPLLSLAACPK